MTSMVPEPTALVAQSSSVAGDDAGTGRDAQQVEFHERSLARGVDVQLRMDAVVPIRLRCCDPPVFPVGRIGLEDPLGRGRRINRCRGAAHGAGDAARERGRRRHGRRRSVHWAEGRAVGVRAEARRRQAVSRTALLVRGPDRVLEDRLRQVLRLQRFGAALGAIGLTSGFDAEEHGRRGDDEQHHEHRDQNEAAACGHRAHSALPIRTRRLRLTTWPSTDVNASVMSTSGAPPSGAATRSKRSCVTCAATSATR